LLPQDGACHEQLGVQAGLGKRQAVGHNPGKGKVVVRHFGGSLDIGLDERIAQKATVEDQFSTLEGASVGQEWIDVHRGGKDSLDLAGRTLHQRHSSRRLDMGEGLSELQLRGKDR